MIWDQREGTDRPPWAFGLFSSIFFLLGWPRLPLRTFLSLVEICQCTEFSSVVVNITAVVTAATLGALSARLDKPTFAFISECLALLCLVSSAVRAVAQLVLKVSSSTVVHHTALSLLSLSYARGCSLDWP